jgi:hypothetical protein
MAAGRFQKDPIGFEVKHLGFQAGPAFWCCRFGLHVSPEGLERETEKVGATVIDKQAVTQNVATNQSLNAQRN